MAPKPPRTVDLDRWAIYTRGAPPQSLSVAAADLEREGAVTLVDVGSGRTVWIAALPKIRHAHLHPSKHLLALIDDETGELLIRDFDGSRVFEHDPSRFRNQDDDMLEAGFLSCFFDRDGDYLWCVHRASPGRRALEIELRETAHWSIVGSVAVKDPFGESICSFHETSKPDVVALHLGAGQNGQWVYWVTRRSDSLDVKTTPFLKDTTEPVFAPGGSQFLVIAAQTCDMVRKYSFPAGRELGACGSPWGKKDWFGYRLCYLDKTNAVEVVRSVEGVRFGKRF